MTSRGRDEEPCEPLATPIDLDPRPQVVRLNRRALGVAGGLLTGVALATVLTLSKERPEGEDHAGPAEARAGAAERFWESEPDVIPRLPPEASSPATDDGSPSAVGRHANSPGDGVPVLPDRSDRIGPEPLGRARSSPILVFSAPNSQSPAGAPRPASAAAVTAAPDLDPSEVLRAASGLGPSGGDDPVVSQNLQREKRAFLRESRLAAEDEVLRERVRAPVSPFEVKAGSVIPAVLVTRASSDLPGPLIGQVRENVYDTATGSHLLIPQGTRTLGTYDSLVAFGQERILVAWQRLIFPNGSSLNLESMPAADESGAAGLADRVNHHRVRVFGAATLLSAISAGLQISQGTFRESDSTTGSRDLGEILAAALGQNLGELGTEIARRNLNLQPTIEVRPGYRFHIAVMKDLVFPAPYWGEWEQD